MPNIKKFCPNLLDTHRPLLVCNSGTGNTLTIAQLVLTQRKASYPWLVILADSPCVYWASNTGEIVDNEFVYCRTYTLMLEPRTITKYANVYNRCATMFDTEQAARQAAQPDCLVVAHPIEVPEQATPTPQPNLLRSPTGHSHIAPAPDRSGH